MGFSAKLSLSTTIRNRPAIRAQTIPHSRDISEHLHGAIQDYLERRKNSRNLRNSRPRVLKSCSNIFKQENDSRKNFDKAHTIFTMITTYITSLKTAFNPFQATSKVPRLFLNLLPAEAHKSIKISAKQFPRTSTAPAVLELGLKDGKTLKYSWDADALKSTASTQQKVKRTSLQDIVEEVNRHARVLDRKAELSG